MAIELNTRLVPIPGITPRLAASPLGLLAPLGGGKSKWVGTGFNQIFRPFHGPGSDNFLELNLTTETLEFTEIPGEIPNRGFAQGDISLFGLTYIQQISDANVKDTNGNPAGIHIEPGIWLNIQGTDDPHEAPTVARLANIPHGTALLSQGTATVLPGAPSFPDIDITPFFIGTTNFNRFDSQTLSTPSPFRSPDSDIVGVTQQMVDHPTSVLQEALAGKTINSTTEIKISTASGAGAVPDSGGGISDIAFLDGSGDPANPNAQVVSMNATFWISEYTDASGSGTMLQYAQVVLLNFAPLSWPHVSVATLIKQDERPPQHPAPPGKNFQEGKQLKQEVKENKEAKPEIKELKLELKEIESIPIPPLSFPPNPPDPGRAGPAFPAPSAGQHFIAPEERPDVSGGPLRAGPAASAPTRPAPEGEQAGETP